MAAQPSSFSTIISKTAGFSLCVVGKPGSGKTTLIKNLLTAVFSDKFSYILIVSPSIAEYEGMVPGTQMTSVFSMEWLIKMFNMINVTMQKAPSKVLVVLDDCISEIKDKQKDPKLINLFFNRRHILWNGVIDLIITTQKYTMFPAKFRSCLTDIALYNISPFDMAKIFEESIIRFTKTQWELEVAKIFEKEFTYVHLDIDKQVINLSS